MSRTADAASGSPAPAVVRRVALLLRLSLGFIWLFTGLVCIAGTSDGLTLIERVGIHGASGLWTIRLTAAFEILLGTAVMAGLRPRLLAIVQIVLIVGFTIIISIFLPESWLHPFGPVSKNVVLIAAAYALGRLSEDFGGRLNRG